MSSSGMKILYKPGENNELDERFSEYKKRLVWWGCSIFKALTKEETDWLIPVEKKAKLTPWKLYVDEVSKLVVGLWFFV